MLPQAPSLSDWRARSACGAPLTPGEHVTVEAVEDDLSLVVGSTHPNERA